MINLVILNDSLIKESNLKKLETVLTNFQYINLDADLNVFEWKKFFKENKVKFYDFVNTSKSKAILSFVSNKKNTSSFFNLKYLYRSMSHFKFCAKFFQILGVPSLKVLSKKEQKIANFTSRQVLEFFDNKILGVYLYDESFFKVVESIQDLDEIKMELMEKSYFYSEICNIENELTVIVKSNEILRVCNESNSLDSESKVLEYVQAIQKVLPDGIWSMVFCHTKSGYKIKYLKPGLNKWILENLDASSLTSFLNYE